MALDGVWLRITLDARCMVLRVVPMDAKKA